MLTGKPDRVKSKVIPWEGWLLMIGIYKITNKSNGKMYIGQSNDIQRRFYEHQTKGESSRIPLDIEIKELGKDAFTYEVLEECEISQLNEKEAYWEVYYNAREVGYNKNKCGQTNLYGENNPNCKLTESDIYFIRQSYNQHKKQKEVYQLFKDKVSFSYFQNLWQGRSWTHIMPEVFTEANKQYYIYENSKGSNGAKSEFSEEEIIEIRTRYMTESAKLIYEDYKDRVKFQTFQAILWGRSYTNLPVYSKKQKKWITN